MRIIAVGGPKGGKGASTTTVTLAAIAAGAGLSVLLVDGDTNRSSTDMVEQAKKRQAEQGKPQLGVEVVDGQDPGALRQLRRAGGFDLAMVDLPGAREGAFEAVLKGDGQPVCDLLVMPVAPETMELRPTLRVVRAEIVPLKLPYLLVFTRVRTASLPRAREDQAELRGAGMQVASTIIRNFTIYDEAVRSHTTVLDIPGAHSYARAAEADYRALAAEVFVTVGMK